MKLRFGILVAMLIIVAACSEGPYPGSEMWPNGRPVHPRMADPPAEDLFAKNSCAIGLNDLGYGIIETWSQDPHWTNVDEWVWGYYETAAGAAPTYNDCVQWWQSLQPHWVTWYWCGDGLKPYYYNTNPDYIAVFTQYFLCDANGFAYWDCRAAGDCLSTFRAATENQSVREGWPTEDTMNDPTNPNPPEPVVCTPDPRDTRMCLEMEPQ